MPDNPYDHIDEYYEDLSWNEVCYDDPNEYHSEEVFEYLSWLSEQEHDYDDRPF